MMILAVTFMMAVVQAETPPMEWTDGHDLRVEGQAWTETKAPWDRLPAKAEGVVRDPVWNLSRQSAGIALQFRTDAPEIHVRWTLTSDRLEMAHMPATGVSGVDLYLNDGNAWRWANTPRPKAKENTARMVSGLEPVMRDWMLYLPLYNGVESIEVGVPAGATLEPMPSRPADELPIVFYGTSITHGACASRPGMCHVAIVGRDLDREVINLGFSGNGTMDLEIADLMAEIDAAVYIVDCLPNLTGERTAKRAVPFVKRLRGLRPDTPIVLVEDRTYSDNHVNDNRRKRNEGNRAALQAAWKTLRDEGMTNLYYLEGDTLLDADGDSTVDGSHPTDLGFRQQADAFIEVLGPVLASGSTESGR
ncbi:MAG: SGNH/GDSL hydrolase family protein [Phycisphaerales bacterium]|nr:SGNH/GDSL hydrolase family protein [Phycisphaerales bacterium]